MTEEKRNKTIVNLSVGIAIILGASLIIFLASFIEETYNNNKIVPIIKDKQQRLIKTVDTLRNRGEKRDIIMFQHYENLKDDVGDLKDDIEDLKELQKSNTKEILEILKNKK